MCRMRKESVWRNAGGTGGGRTVSGRHHHVALRQLQRVLVRQLRGVALVAAHLVGEVEGVLLGVGLKHGQTTG